MKKAIAELQARQSLSRKRCEELMQGILDDVHSESDIADFLLALRAKGEGAEEVLGFLDCLRGRAVRVDSPVEAVDVCGTGGDGLGTFNVSTAVAFVVAACGVPIAKHGNRSVSSRSGSFDVLEKLGLPIQADPAQAARSLREHSLAFLFAPAFHPALAKVASIRKRLGVYTVFNLLGPLLNPLETDAQLIGVYRADLLPLVSEVLRARGTREAMVVHGSDGLDELTLTGPTQVAHLKNGEITFYALLPENFGLSRASLAEVAGGSAEENAAILKAIFDGEKGPRRDLVLMNASAALRIAGKAADFKAGVALAAQALDSGRVKRLLAQMTETPTGTVLDRIAVKVRAALETRKALLPETELRRLCSARAPAGRFEQALRAPGLRAIAEIKFASPSEGTLVARDRDPVAVARDYLQNGAAALSILTEENHFEGRLEYLARVREAFPQAPLLMKDFVLEPYQIYEALRHGADAILLIVSLLGEEKCRAYLALARELGLSALVEVHDEAELAVAQRIGASLVGVNNRNLKTLSVSLDTSFRLSACWSSRADKPGPDAPLLVSESGIRHPDDLKRLEEAGFGAVLVGTALMKTASPGAALAELLGAYAR